MNVLDLMRQRILLLDGAIGSRLISFGAKGCLELLNCDNPAVVESLHREYLAAKADIITTNTFCSDALSLKQYNLESRSYEITLAGATLARKAVSRVAESGPHFVAGSIGPTTRNLSLATDTSAEQIAEAYATVARALIDGGVDMILIESAMDVKNICIAVDQVRQYSLDIPIVMSAVLSRLVGRVASGATLDKFLEQLPLADITVLGFNCSGTPSTMEPTLQMFCEQSDKPTIFYPSVGQERLSANNFAKQMDGVMRKRMVNIVGGCCGTTPDHIAALQRVASRWQARRVNI